MWVHACVCVGAFMVRACVHERMCTNVSSNNLQKMGCAKIWIWQVEDRQADRRTSSPDE